jgi:hypothetical protein
MLCGRPAISVGVGDSETGYGSNGRKEYLSNLVNLPMQSQSEYNAPSPQQYPNDPETRCSA